MSPLSRLAAAAFVALLAATSPSDAVADVHAFQPVGREGGKLVFDVGKLNPYAVRRASLRVAGRRSTVRASRVRAAAQRGKLRVATSAARRARGARLEVTTTCTSKATAYTRLIRSTPGLVSLWRLGERSGAAACDFAGRNGGRYVGSRTRRSGATRDGDRALGTTGRTTVRVPSSKTLNPRSAITLEAWVRPSTVGASQTIVRKEEQYLLRMAGGRLIGRLWLGGEPVELETGAIVRQGVWQHVALTYDGSVLRLLRNGVVVRRVAAAGLIAATPASLYLASSIGAYDFMRGDIDDVAVYSTAVAPTDLLARLESEPPVGARPLPGADEAGQTEDAPAGDPEAERAPGRPSSPQVPSVPAGPGAPGPAPEPTAACPTGVSWGQGFGGFTRTSWPSGCWRAFADSSPFNTPIPAGAPTWSGSGEIVNWFRAQGNGPLDWPLTGYNSYAPTTYYGNASDPVYKIVRDSSTLSYGPSSIDGAQLHAPVGMKVNRDYDSIMSIVDQTTGTEYDFWYVSAINDTARTITVKWGGKLPVDGSGVMGEDGYSFESGFGMQFGYIRAAELAAGRINHALYLCVPGVRGRVAPAVNTGGNFANKAGMPPMGARMQLTLSDAEIEAVTLGGQPAPWYYKVILRAAAQYGMVVSDEGDSPWGGLRIESGLQYTAQGQPNPWEGFAREQNVPVMSGGMGKAPYFQFTALKDASGQSVWRNLRMVAPSAHGYSDALR